MCDPEEGPGWEPWRAERGYIRWGGGQVGGPSSRAKLASNWGPRTAPASRVWGWAWRWLGPSPTATTPPSTSVSRVSPHGPAGDRAPGRKESGQDWKAPRSRAPWVLPRAPPQSSGELEQGASLRPWKPSPQDLERMGDRSRHGQGLPHSDGVFPPGWAARGPRGPEPDRHGRRYSKRAGDCGRVRPPAPTWPALPSGSRLTDLLPGFLEPGELPEPLARRGAFV